MIIIQATSIDELNQIWKKLRGDFQVIEAIHLDHKSLQYRMVINQPELTKMLQGVAEKVIDRVDMYEEDSFKGILTLNQLHEKLTGSPEKMLAFEPLAKIWSVISESDRKAIFAYLQTELKGVKED
jgi:hypothetical protein